MAERSETRKNRLVTIICRSIGRPVLKNALDSIFSQSYAPIEVILVNSSRKQLKHLFPTDFNVTVLDQEKPLSRPDAANAGIDAANGYFLMFLDDDDYISSDHVANLVSKIQSSSSIRAVYSSTQKVTIQGKSLNQIYSTEFDQFLLMRDNYIPIHSMLFEKSLIEEACRFDPQFEIYEDWDFWLQLAQKTKFVHIPCVTAFYRAGGDSGTMPADDSERFNSGSKIGKARAQIFEKWRTQWTGNQINGLIGNTMRIDLAENYEELAKHSEDLEAQLTLINEQLNRIKMENESQQTKLNEEILFLTSSLQVSLDTNSDLKTEIQKREETEKHLRLHESQLELALEQILNSRTWKIAGLYRRLGNLLTRSRSTSENLKVEENASSGNIEEVNALASSEQKAESTKKKNAASPRLGNAKKAYDEKAKEELDVLLNSSERLVFPKAKDIKLSIIIVLYNQAHLGLLCFKSLLDHANVNFELVIIDNASKDRTKDLLARIDNAEIIRNDKNLGFVEAVNQGGEIAKGQYILLLNNDAIIQEKALSNAIRTMDSDSNVGAVGGKIKLINGTLQEAGSIIWNDGSCLGYGRGENPNDPKFNFKRQVDYCSGAFLLLRNADFSRLGGFDTDYAPAYYEESDFCIRLQKFGLKIIYDPSVEIVHYEFASSGNTTDALSLQKRNRKILLGKHSEWLATKHAPTQEKVLLARSANDFENILLIDDRVPHPALGSGYPRCADILNSLASFDYNITLFPLQFPIDDWKSCYETLDHSIEIILNQGKSGLDSFLRSREGFFQYIIISRVHNMEFLRSLAKDNRGLLDNAKIIYDAEALTASREIIRRSLQGRGVTSDKQVEMIRSEMEKCSMADSVIAVSEQEAQAYKNHGMQNVHVLGHKISANPGDNTFINREGLLFVGALRDEGSPNVDSLLWFCINVLPLIEKKLENIKIYVVGDLGAPSLFTIKKENLSFLGQIKDLSEIYNRCRVFIAPTRFAAGIPHKVHHATANGIPCVTTELLANQLRWTPEKELLVGKTSYAFAAECIRLHEDQNLWENIRKNGLKAVEKDCSEANFRDNLKSIFT